MSFYNLYIYIIKLTSLSLYPAVFANEIISNEKIPLLTVGGSSITPFAKYKFFITSLFKIISIGVLGLVDTTIYQLISFTLSSFIYFQAIFGFNPKVALLLV